MTPPLGPEFPNLFNSPESLLSISALTIVFAIVAWDMINRNRYR